MSSFLIDPVTVIKFDRTDDELELWWLFSAVVAGKTARTQARLLDKFLRDIPFPSSSPFMRIASAHRDGSLLDRLKRSGLGQYNRLHRQFVESLSLDLRRCSVEDLERVYGCGPKTARMFLMMSRPNQRFAALDTHVLKHLRANGIAAPKTTPSAGKLYQKLEAEFLKLADASGMSVADYDLKVWKEYSK